MTAVSAMAATASGRGLSTWLHAGAALAGIAAILTGGFPPPYHGGALAAGIAAVIAAGSLLLILRRGSSSIRFSGILEFAAVLLVFHVVISMLTDLPARERASLPFWLYTIMAWLFAWGTVERMSPMKATGNIGRLMSLAIPALFGITLLFIWEAVTRGGNIPSVLLPSPSAIWEPILNSLPIHWADFQQTFLKAVLAGYAMGCGLGFLTALAIDRSAFLKRGLLPIGNFVSALPIIGIAPIMVMWFGFDWQSKAAVVVVMTFFPMLVNTVQGLSSAGQMERDLMNTYASSWWQTLTRLRLPAAAPFIFNALKINSTLALIGAIVAEFFGTPIVGMGFRISAEIGRMNTDMVWAEIAVAALAGSTFYGVIALIERSVTFWHPSVRSSRT